MNNKKWGCIGVSYAICSIARNGRVTEDVTHPSRRIVDTLVRLEDLMTSQVPS